jgi:hypothetical protein
VFDNSRRQPGLRFSPCVEDPSLDCGTLLVPVDYDKPYGETVGIAVIRGRATKPNTRIGVIVGNPGGPGISGIDFLLAVAPSPGIARLRERFDIVSFDPRGVGRSRQVRCDFTLPPAPPQSDDIAIAEFLDELGRRHAQACLEQNGSFVRPHRHDQRRARHRPDQAGARRVADHLRGRIVRQPPGSDLCIALSASRARDDARWRHCPDVSRLQRRVLVDLLTGVRADLPAPGSIVPARPRLPSSAHRCGRSAGRSAGAARGSAGDRTQWRPAHGQPPAGHSCGADRQRTQLAAHREALADAQSGDYGLLFQLLPVGTGSNPGSFRSGATITARGVRLPTC